MATVPCVAQLSPPGLDDTQAVAWGAVGVSQQLSDHWSMTVYVGASRESDPDNYKALHKQAIAVVNEETVYKFNTRWQLGMAASFRIQNKYEEVSPFDVADPEHKNEARYYLRLYRKANIGKAAMTYSFRPEYRTFYANGHSLSSNPEEIRLRLKVQAAFSLNAGGSNQVIVANEVLSATDDKKGTDGHLHWTAVAYTEDRFTTYFRHAFKKTHILVDAGVMHEIKMHGGYIPHLAFDVIVVDPFKSHKKS